MLTIRNQFDERAARFGYWLSTRFVAVVTGLVISVTAGAQTTMKFGDGAGQVIIPAYYIKVEDKDASLVVLSKPEGNVRLYFDLHKLDAADKLVNPGVGAVRLQAEKKGKQVKQRGEKVIFFDPSPAVKEGDEVVINFHWQIGFGKTAVVMSARIPRSARDAPDVMRFLSGDLESIIDSLQRIDD